jgi:intraflagellar transport protein 122
MSEDLLLSQAQHEEDNGNWKEAANLYTKCKHFKEAINVYGKKGVLDPILNILKILNKEQHNEEIQLCAKYFKEMNHHTYAKQAILKLGDIKSLIALHIEFYQWNEALQQIKSHPHYADRVYLPYADWLAANDRFEEAQEAYKKAKKPDLALRIIEFLTRNAVIEKRFRDAAKYFFILACEYLRLVEDSSNPSKNDFKNLKKFEENSKKAEIYHAYGYVHRLIEDPYHSMVHGALINETIFNASRFLVNSIGGMSLPGINKVYIYYALSLLGTKFEAFRTARYGYEKLQTLKISPEWQEEIDLASLKIRCKPFSDKESHQPVCNRCMNINSLINQNGDFCTACGHPFVRNFIGFDTLPLVEFVPDPRIPPGKVLDLLKEEPDDYNKGPSKPTTKKQPSTDGWKEDIYGEQQILAFDRPQADDGENDLFTTKMLEWLETQVTADEYRPIEVDEQILKSLRYSEVFIVDLRHVCPSYPLRYFRNVIPDVSIGL